MSLRHRILAPAKVNLTLEVSALLPGGYHELDTIFCWLELGDVLEWTDAAQASLEMLGWAEGIETDESNLVMRALRLLEKKTERALPLAIRLHKHIPAGGGLGGGSSDAAALLYGLNLSHKLGVKESDLQAWGGELGADVAFCVLGGTARGTGRGEQLEALAAPQARDVILAIPNFGCPTPEIYRLFDARPDRVYPGSSHELQHRLAQGGGWDDLLSNDLQAAAEIYRPELIDLRQQLLEAGCGDAMLSGSGSTILGFPAPGTVESVMARLEGPSSTRFQATRLCGRPRPQFAALESHD